jgi:divalent metal cation (Fe/Co/Zn/Cd) transporter
MRVDLPTCIRYRCIVTHAFLFMTATTTLATHSLYRTALFWALFGVAYNLVEGLVCVALGVNDEALTLFGFGVDSFIEAISASAIVHLVWRLRTQPGAARDRFESFALRVTGLCFYLLAGSLVAGAAITAWRGGEPHSTVAGVVIAVISIAVMWAMLAAKLRVGQALQSDAMIADAQCTRVCIYMSVTLLIASGLYELTGLGYIDSLGSVVLAWFSYREGVEAFDKAAGRGGCGCHHHAC